MKTDYQLKATPSRVDFYSMERLPLQPTGTMHQGREELRRALKLLQPKPGHRLDASLTTLCNGFFDVENILFYNVGPARFKTLSNEGLAFRIHREQPDCPQPFGYHHRYEILPLDLITGKPQLVFHLDSLNAQTKPHEVWWKARQGTYDLLPQSVGRFRLSVTIEGPVASYGLSVIAKRLLDGIVAAFHHDPCPLGPLAVSRLANALGVSNEEVSLALSDPSSTPLGPRKILTVYRNSFKWNPADELCVDCCIRWKPSRTGKVKVSVSIEPVL